MHSKITAMTFLMILLAVALVLSAHALFRALHDDRSPFGPPASHVEDPQFRAPTVC